MLVMPCRIFSALRCSMRFFNIIKYASSYSIIGIDKENYGFPQNMATINNHSTIVFAPNGSHKFNGMRLIT